MRVPLSWLREYVTVRATAEEIAERLFVSSLQVDEMTDVGVPDVDQNLGRADQAFVRYTHDRAVQELPTDFPQFPRTFESTNQFLTGEYRRAFSPRVLATLRGGWSRTRIGQAVEANTTQPVQPFVPGRPFMGDIDITGIPRFGPQSSADVRLYQDVFSFSGDAAYSRGRHLLKAGGLVERYHSDLVNPTFSLGIFTFANLESFLRECEARGKSR